MSDFQPAVEQAPFIVQPGRHLPLGHRYLLDE
jgi:hypothetical protein